MADLQSLVYVSEATRSLSTAELNHLLERARARNAQQGVTGVLLYAHGNFMQYLEGPAEGLLKVYEIIRADPQHHGIIELLQEPIQSREFSDWPMAFRDISAYGASSPANIDAILSAARAAGTPGASGARTLLTKFWHKGGVRSTTY